MRRLVVTEPQGKRSLLTYIVCDMTIIIDIATPGGNRVGAKEKEKIENYDSLKWEIKKMWLMKKVEIVPVVVGALGAVIKNLEQYMERLGIQIKTKHTGDRFTGNSKNIEKNIRELSGKGERSG